MKDLAIVLVICASACTPKPAFVDTGDSPVATCGATFDCAEGGGQGTLLVPVAALVAVTLVFAGAIWGLPSEHPRTHAVPR